ncbi:hypothetical protein [Actinoplanes sp. TFC3]|uniref:hypothetical protein n=1 Tax=Actinoplanes sp. TFC3 TaxID=1710355 RepID=UPI00082FE7D2|nr:hypothetical protein [Actinoplanes sp. TFC3]
MADLRPRFTDDTETHPALKLTAAPQPFHLTVDSDTRLLLSDGLGRYDMEIRWLAHLDDAGVLRIWRSWTGYQIYQAVLERQRAGQWSIRELAVELDPDRYRGSLSAEPAQFDAVLSAVVTTLRRFRAGHTPYGATPDADPLPPPWP